MCKCRRNYVSVVLSAYTEALLAPERWWNLLTRSELMQKMENIIAILSFSPFWLMRFIFLWVNSFFFWLMYCYVCVCMYIHSPVALFSLAPTQVCIWTYMLVNASTHTLSLMYSITRTCVLKENFAFISFINFYVYLKITARFLIYIVLWNLFFLWHTSTPRFNFLTHVSHVSTFYKKWSPYTLLVLYMVLHWFSVKKSL